MNSAGNPIKILSILILIGIAASVALTADFFAEDYSVIVNNRHLNLEDLKSVAQPVTKLSFALNQAWGGENPWSYRLVNLVIHGLNVILAYFVLLALFRRVKVAEQRVEELALAAAMIFGLHPAAAAATIYISQRASLLAICFMLGALLCYSRAGRQNGPARIGWIVACLGLGVLGFLSKGEALLLPFFILLWEGIGRREERSLIKAAALAVILGVLAVLTSGFYAGSFKAYENTPLIKLFVQHLLSLPRILSYYMSLYAFPWPSRFNFVFDYQLSESFWRPFQTLLSWFLWAAAGWWIIRQGLERKTTVWGMAWFIITVVGASSPPQVTPLADSRLYIPALGLAITAAGAFFHLAHGRELRKKIYFCGLALLLFIGTIAYNYLWRDPAGLWTAEIEKTKARRPPTTFDLALAYNERALIYFDQSKIAEQRAVKPGQKPDAITEAESGSPTVPPEKWREKVFSDFRESLKYNPDLVETYLSRGLVHFYYGEDMAALNDFQSALLRDPRLAAAYYHRGVVLYSLGKKDQALQDFDQALQLNPAFTDAYISRGAAYSEKGDLARAEQDFRRALALTPDSSDAYYNLGLIAQMRKQYPQALSSFSHAYELNPDFIEALRSRALLNYNLDRTKEALQDINQLLKALPQEAELYRLRGEIHYLNKNSVLALADLTRALDLGLKKKEIFNNRANIYRDQGQFDQAQADYREALALDPQYALAYNNRGIAYYQKGDCAAAQADFTQAIKLRPAYGIAYANRGQAYKCLKQEAAAQADLQEACRLGIAGACDRLKQKPAVRQ